MLVFEKDLNNIPLEVVSKMASNINPIYIYELLEESENELVFYSFDTNVDILNCPCSLIYKANACDEECVNNIYILFLATSYKFRKLGYAGIFMREFIDYIKDKYSNANVILDSVIESVTFYEHIGFKWITEDVDKYYEELNIKLDTELEHFIMIYKF